MSKLNISAQCMICKEFFKFPSGVNQLGFHLAFGQFDLEHDKCEKLEKSFQDKLKEETKAQDQDVEEMDLEESVEVKSIKPTPKPTSGQTIKRIGK